MGGGVRGACLREGGVGEIGGMGINHEWARMGHELGGEEGMG